ncbi:hypothetical protein [Halovenus salina]|uniref:hypothetical protein n=1 Tax=Halovenus salina TaxID=1510225 RepID=UPI0022609A5C|nr:hypothetical protein [Halovenus salina]
MTDSDEDPLADVPDWDDEYVDRVSDRLFHNYDLEQDRRVQGQRFTLYGRLKIKRRKQFIHPALTYGDHETTEHLFVRRVDDVSVADLERLSELSDALADEWIDADEEHFGTEFVFGLVAPEVPADIREYVSDYESRTLLKYGYHGHYTVRLFVVAPEQKASVASPDTDVVRAFRLWDEPETETESAGVFARLRAALSRRS